MIPHHAQSGVVMWSEVNKKHEFCILGTRFLIFSGRIFIDSIQNLKYRTTWRMREDRKPLKIYWTNLLTMVLNVTMGIPCNNFYSEVDAMFKCDQCDCKPATSFNLTLHCKSVQLIFHQVTCERTKILSTEGIF